MIGALLVRGINKPEYDVNQTPFQSPNKLVTPIFRQVSEELKPCLDQLGQFHNGVEIILMSLKSVCFKRLQLRDLQVTKFYGRVML